MGVRGGVLGMMAALGLSLVTVHASAQATPTPPGGQSTLSCPPQSYCEEVDLGPPDEGGDDGQLPSIFEEELPPPGSSQRDNADRDGSCYPYCESEAADWAPMGHTTEAAKPKDGPLTTAGATIFGLGYGPAMLLGLIGAALDEIGSAGGDELMPFLVPVIGPPIAGAVLEPSQEVWTVLLVDSAIQALGITLLAIGVSMDEKNKAAAKKPSIRPHLATDGRRNLVLGLRGAF